MGHKLSQPNLALALIVIGATIYPLTPQNTLRVFFFGCVFVVIMDVSTESLKHITMINQYKKEMQICRVMDSLKQ